MRKAPFGAAARHHMDAASSPCRAKCAEPGHTLPWILPLTVGPLELKLWRRRRFSFHAAFGDLKCSPTGHPERLMIIGPRSI
jgi:hypothetical protein